MDYSSYLSPTAIKAMCSEAKNKLTIDNNLYSLQLTYIKNFVDDNSNNSSGFDAVKEHMDDYSLIIEGMIDSNDLDYADYFALENSVGDEELVGKDILTAKITAENKRDCYNSIADGYERDALNVEWYEGWLAIAYLNAARKYRNMANEQDAIYQTMLAKEMFYDSVCSTTASLFSNSVPVRSAVTSGISALMLVFDVFPVILPSSCSWRNYLNNHKVEINESIVETMFLNHDSSIPYTEQESKRIIDAMTVVFEENGIDLSNCKSLSDYEELYCDFILERAINNTGLQNPFAAVDAEGIQLLYVKIYEDAHIEHREAMDSLFAELPEEYYEDGINVRFIAYTAAEPAKTVFFQYVGDIQIKNFDVNDTQYWSPSKVGVYLDFDNYTYTDDNGKLQTVYTGKADPRGPYVTIFHELAHAIDDLSAKGKGVYYTENFEFNGFTLQKAAEMDVYNDLTVAVDQACVDLKFTLEDYSYDERKNLVNTMIGSRKVPISLDPNNKLVYEMVLSYYTSDPTSRWNLDSNGNSLGVANSNSSAPLELITDIWGGYTDQRIDVGYQHRDEDYWYNFWGKQTNAQSKEFFAEYFSYQMTNSPLNQMVVVQNNFEIGSLVMEQMISSMVK